MPKKCKPKKVFQPYVTYKQERALQEYIKDRNPKLAGIRAGYSKSNAEKVMERLLVLSHIKSRLAEIEDEIRQRNNIEIDYFICNLKSINENIKTKNSDRISALTLLAKLTGYLKDKPDGGKQVVILQQGLRDNEDKSIEVHLTEDSEQ